MSIKQQEITTEITITKEQKRIFINIAIFISSMLALYIGYHYYSQSVGDYVIPKVFGFFKNYIPVEDFFPQADFFQPVWHESIMNTIVGWRDYMVYGTMVICLFITCLYTFDNGAKSIIKSTIITFIIGVLSYMVISCLIIFLTWLFAVAITAIAIVIALVLIVCLEPVYKVRIVG